MKLWEESTVEQLKECCFICSIFIYLEVEIIYPNAYG